MSAVAATTLIDRARHRPRPTRTGKPDETDCGSPVVAKCSITKALSVSARPDIERMAMTRRPHVGPRAAQNQFGSACRQQSNTNG
jgi:hypothetical protein